MPHTLSLDGIYFACHNEFDVKGILDMPLGLLLNSNMNVSSVIYNQIVRTVVMLLVSHNW